MTSSNADFATRVLDWFDCHGRKDLPWQQAVTPYRVWVSEIMLQQTQVATVIPYFERFMQRFPTLMDLAQAPLDDVLHLWTGLGYYARGRNLHKAARLAVSEYGGALPEAVDDLCTLPGIGRSTAGAIRSLGHGLPAAILDGNVKRVLARHEALAGDPAKADVLKQFWAVAEAYTPLKRTSNYNQAMMDLGATLCTRSKPACAVCPLKDSCKGLKSGNPTQFPQKKRKSVVPEKSVRFLIRLNEQYQVWLEQRPAVGIWGGLWGFPEQTIDAPLAENTEQWPAFWHVFSHFRLHIHPAIVRVSQDKTPVVNEASGQWVTLAPPPAALPALGLPTPVQQLLQRLQAQLESEK